MLQFEKHTSGPVLPQRGVPDLLLLPQDALGQKDSAVSAIGESCKMHLPPLEINLFMSARRSLFSLLELRIYQI